MKNIYFAIFMAGMAVYVIVDLFYLDKLYVYDEHSGEIGIHEIISSTEKMTVLIFLSDSCSSCLTKNHELLDIYSYLNHEVEFFGIIRSSSYESASKYAYRSGIKFPFFQLKYDDSKKLDGLDFPVTHLFDETNKEVFSSRGEASYSDLLEYMRSNYEI